MPASLIPQSPKLEQVPAGFGVQAINRRASDPEGEFRVVGTLCTHYALRPGGRMQGIHGGDLILLPQPSPHCPYQTPDHAVPVPEVGRPQDHNAFSGFDLLAPDWAAPPSVKTYSFMKPVVLHAPPCILSSPTCCHRRARHVHRLRTRLRHVQPAIALYPELGLHGHQSASHHLFLRGPCTTLQSCWQTGLVIFHLSPVNRSFGVKTPFTAVRGHGRHRERSNRRDKGLQPVDLTHHSWTPDTRPRCPRHQSPSPGRDHPP